MLAQGKLLRNVLIMNMDRQLEDISASMYEKEVSELNAEQIYIVVVCMLKGLLDTFIRNLGEKKFYYISSGFSKGSFLENNLKNLGIYEIMEGVLKLYDRIINPNLLIRRVNISVNNLIRESERCEKFEGEQMDFFTDYEKKDREKSAKKARYAREKSRQNALIAIKKKYGGNAVLKGMNLTEGATTIDRNKQIGGHKS